jgi:hypothetical protein
MSSGKNAMPKMSDDFKKQMKAAGWSPEEIKRSEIRGSIMPDLSKESDRAVGVLAAAFVEEELDAYVRRQFIRSDKSYLDMADSLFKGRGPLATFSTKIDMGWLLGLYGEHARKQLHTIREIRNAFAHKATAGSFEAQPARDYVPNLTIGEMAFTPSVEPGEWVLQYPGMPVGLLVKPDDPSVPLAGKTLRDRYIFTCMFFVSAFTNHKGAPVFPPPPF